MTGIQFQAKIKDHKKSLSATNWKLFLALRSGWEQFKTAVSDGSVIHWLWDVCLQAVHTQVQTWCTTHIIHSSLWLKHDLILLKLNLLHIWTSVWIQGTIIWPCQITIFQLYKFLSLYFYFLFFSYPFLTGLYSTELYKKQHINGLIEMCYHDVPWNYVR